MLPALFSELTALVPAPPGAAACDGDGHCRRAALKDAREIFQSGRALVAHAAFVAGRLKAPATKPLYDVLELFAFVRHRHPLVPSALGLARALGLELPHTPEKSASALFAVAHVLLQEAGDAPPEMRARLAPLAATLARSG